MNRPRDRSAAEKRGRSAETFACWYLRFRGWTILARRARVPGGEVVQREGGGIVIGARLHLDEGQGMTPSSDDIDYRLRRVAVAAERLAPRYLRDGDDLRIDALFVVPGRWPRHLANVWQGR